MAGVRIMPNVIVFGAIVFLFVAVSVRERVRLRLMREKDWSIIGEAKSSHISQALTNLVGVAGGIYLILVVLVAFLELNLPEQVQVGNISLEPLAAVSIFIALVQPFMIRALDAWRRI